MEPKQADPDPYDREKVLDKLAEHAWNHKTPKGDLKHRQEFIDKGINSEAELRKAIAEGIERSDTPAFSTRPDPLKSQKESREFYEVSMKDKQGEPYKLLVIVNPGPDKRGDLSGGTAYIPDNDKQFKVEFDNERDRRHNRKVNWEPQLVMGGRPALREQEQQQQRAEPQKQVSEYQPSPPPKFDPKYAREELTPTLSAKPETAPPRQQFNSPPQNDPRQTAKPEQAKVVEPERKEPQPQTPTREQAAPERKQDPSAMPPASEQTMKPPASAEPKAEPQPVQRSRPPSFDPKFAKETIGPPRNKTVEPPSQARNCTQASADAAKKQPTPEPSRQQSTARPSSEQQRPEPSPGRETQSRKEPEPSSRGPQHDSGPYIEQDEAPKGPRR